MPHIHATHIPNGVIKPTVGDPVVTFYSAIGASKIFEKKVTRIMYLKISSTPSLHGGLVVASSLAELI